jgi:hypothetical protein
MRLVVCVVLSMLPVLGCGSQENPAKVKDAPEPAVKEATLTFAPRRQVALVVEADKFEETVAGKLDDLEGKLIEISGKVQRVEYLPETGAVTLASASKKSGITCATKDPEPWRQAVPGQRVTLQGTLAGIGVGEIEDAVIVAAGPSDLKSVAADQLVGLSTTSPKTPPVGYGTFLLVTGQVVEVKAIDPSFNRIVLKGAKGRNVHCHFGSFASNLTKKPGDQVKIIGSIYALPQEAADELRLDECVLFP